jgi:hypothetical protein
MFYPTRYQNPLHRSIRLNLAGCGTTADDASEWLMGATADREQRAEIADRSIVQARRNLGQAYEMLRHIDAVLVNAGHSARIPSGA